jgi:hypothetical protein
MEIDLERFTTLCEDENINPRTKYTGRGMYGTRCIGIVGSTKDLVRFMLKIVPLLDPMWDTEWSHDGVMIPEYSPEWENVSHDTMGTQLIYYWPAIKAVESEDSKDPDRIVH